MFKDLLQSILPLFTEQLAKLFDKLRLASPIVYLVVTGLIAGAVQIITNNPDLIAGAPEWVEYVVIVIGIIAPIVLSSRTKRHIPAEQEKVSTAQLKVLSAEEVEILRDQDD